MLGLTVIQSVKQMSFNSENSEQKIIAYMHMYRVQAYRCSIQFSRSVMSDSLLPHGLQHARLPVHHQLQKPAQTHVRRVSDAIQPCHPLSSPSPPAFNLSKNQGLFQ